MKQRSLLIATLICASISGCSATPEAGTDDFRQRTFAVATRQLPPEPPYNRLRWVHLPETLPSELPPAPQASLETVLEFEVRNIPLEEAAQILAASSRYSSFTASTVAGSKVSLRTLGTLEEIADQLAAQAGARAFVDHSDRALRFVAGSTVAPRFFEEDAQSGVVTGIE